MVMFLFLQFVTLLFVFVLIFCYYKVLTKLNTDFKYQYLDFGDFLLTKKNFKGIILAVIFGLIWMTVICSKDLFLMTKCQINSVAMNVESQYSWMMKQCLIKSESGAYLPLKQTRTDAEGL